VHRYLVAKTDKLFMRGNIALGWPQMGDLSRLPNDRAAFREEVASFGHGTSPRTIGADAGMLFRFVYEMKPGDLVVYRSPGDNLIHVGRLVGPYRHDTSLSEEYHHLRHVDWLAAHARDVLSAEAQRSLMARRSLFQVRAGADDFRAAV